MYHHHSQQGSQPFPNGPRPPHRQPPPNQHQNRPDMMSQVMGFQFPRPTQLPDELESALAIRGARDVDHRVIDHLSQSNQHQNPGSGSGIGQHGSYISSPAPISSDNQPGHQQGVDWSSYQPSTKGFVSPQSTASHLPQQHQGPPQQPQSSHTGTSNPTWTAPLSDSPSPQSQHPHGVGGDGQGLYTPESAGSILASFGLSNEDLEVLSHYPDEQLTPDTLPFILRDIQINKSGNQKTMASTSTPSFSCIVHDMPTRSSPLAHLHAPEVPSLLTVTQTAGKVIDYGHASRSKDENNEKETFKREQLSSERTVKMYPSPSSSSSTPKTNKTERRHGHLEPTVSSKHGDQDYRRINREHRKSNRSPGREFPPSSKSRNLDRDYRHDAPKPRPSPEARSEASSRWSRSSSGSKSHSSSKTLPTPTMISDFSAASPKVYPHTCSLCHIPCDQEKDWVDHINTVNHTAACRDLRNKYPDWKPNLPSRSGQHGHRPAWHPKDHSPSHSVSRSLSGSPPPSPHSTHRVGPHRCRPHGRSFSPHDHHRYQHFAGGSSRSGVKRPHDDPTRLSSDTSRHPPSSKVGHGSKHGPIQSSAKTVKNLTKSGSKTTKTTCAKAADISAKPSPAKKKKKIVTPTSQDSSHADRLVYLTGIPNDASEQEVTDMVRSVGKINNVILMPCSEEEIEKGAGQKASVCMLTSGHAQALANSTNLSIRGQQITASVAKKPGSGQSSDANNSKRSPGQEKAASGEDSAGEAEGKTSDQKGIVLITGLPESGWSESDIISLIQPYGTLCDIILAKQIGKVLVSVSDIETAQEMVKVNSFIPMKIHDCELKMIHVKQHVGFTTPVALYNRLMGSVDPFESSLPVGWSSLVVISNVPDTVTGSSEVQKLVRRFGTVIKTLVLNSVVICEMATAAMALSVYKRFQRFPCIIHNNPLIFSRKPDPKANVQGKVISAYLDSSEKPPANGKGKKMSAPEDEEQTAHKMNAESSSEGMGKASDEKNEEMMSTEKIDCSEDEALEQHGCKDRKDGLAAASDSSAAPHAKAHLETDVRETAENAMETAEERNVVASTAENVMTPAGEAPHSGDKAASPETALPEFPKVTQEMVKALLVECRTSTASHPNDAAASPVEQEEMQMEMNQGEKPVEETEGPAKNDTEEEEMKKQDRKLRDARERERRAKKERERWDRARREREKREEERRQWMRRERERRERKRAHSNVSGPRSAPRLDQHKQSWRGEKVKAQPRTEEQEEEFPFNMSDFVTVDEVGDVTDLPDPPSPSVPTETTEEDALTAVSEEAQGDAPMEVASETTSDATAIPLTCDEHQSEHEAMATDEASDAEVSSGLMFTAAASPAAVCQPGSDPSQTHEPACRPEGPGTETSPTPVSADDFSNSPTRRALTSESGEENKDLTHSQSKEEAVVPDRTEEDEKTQDEEEKETGAPAVGTGKQQRFEDQTHSEEASEKDEVKMEAPMTTDHSLPPFDPSNPVGMEFLVPKTGFLCKPCNRFFTGSREAEISHCKTLKHYDSLQKYLQTGNMVNATNAATSS